MNLQNVLDFEKFVKGEVKKATEELAGLQDGSRNHLQKLVYTNLVDRFDVMVDKTILDNALHERLLDDALKKLDSPVSEADVLKLLMDGSNIHEVVESRVQNILRDGVLRGRHSNKVSKLFELIGLERNLWTKPRVNISTGKILGSFTPQNNKIPTSVCGYADWLYSRRNSIVHGGGSSKMLDNDIAQLKKLFKSDVAKTTRLSYSALGVTSEFYLGVVKLIKDAEA
ncbi:hypothetical protein [Shewanella salipaludis]|uniref:RiboL-PSP-HEPN domain-containing protein n=1 Tax=Shewanella salipaludis TaxID=2723052 RepID=A0A972FWQ8_9GAMM|nr:hypothetical protein [Shewanella salipaludis]NMH67032.1 hypothetical protein [Shewanella salipaludis]